MEVVNTHTEKQKKEEENLKIDTFRDTNFWKSSSK